MLGNETAIAEMIAADVTASAPAHCAIQCAPIEPAFLMISWLPQHAFERERFCELLPHGDVLIGLELGNVEFGGIDRVETPDSDRRNELCRTDPLSDFEAFWKPRRVS